MTTQENQTKLIFLLFFFLLGNLLVGFAEPFIYDHFYMHRYRIFNSRFYIFADFFRAFIVLGFGFFSAYFIYTKSSKTPFHLITKYILIIYYVLFIYILSFFVYYSPLSYLSSIIYTKCNYNEWTDIRKYINKQLVIEQSSKG